MANLFSSLNIQHVFYKAEVDVHKAIVDNIQINTTDYENAVFGLPEYVEKLIKEDAYFNIQYIKYRIDVCNKKLEILNK